MGGRRDRKGAAARRDCGGPAAGRGAFRRGRRRPQLAGRPDRRSGAPTRRGAHRRVRRGRGAGRLASRAPRGGGGLGGAEGLADWLRAHPVRALVDATHPFAAAMTDHAAQAAAATGTPVLRLQRPGWREQPGDDWRRVDSLEAAAAAVAGFAHVFLTTGRMGLGAFAGLTQEVLVRSVDPPAPPLPVRTTVILERGPFTVEEELA